MSEFLDMAYIQKSLPLFLQASRVTLSLAFGGIGLSLGMGILGAVVRHFRVPLLSPMVVLT